MQLDSDDTFPVGQRERLTVRLRSLIRQYQRGPGIIKEFIQNADDAGSSWVRVVVDWRDHGIGTDGNENLTDILGPALLIANGSIFTDSNFDAIQRIGESDKRLSAGKTGRFGLGFNTAYNVTDYPSLVSRDRIFCFDPHEGPVAPKGSTGLGLRLDALRRRFPAWHSAFGAGGLKTDAAFHDGSIFRLPLRSSQRAAKSEISHEPFDRSDVDAIVAKLVADGPAMLLFTRNVLHLRLEEIRPTGGAARTLLDIRTENTDEVSASRKTVHVPPDLDVGDLLKQLEEGEVRRTSHRHTMRISRADTTFSAEWHVCQGFYSDPAGELLSHAHRMLQFEERAIPEAGVAIPLKRSELGELTASECEGLFCCGLPLPAISALPVHVNGCFDLDDSRTKPTTAGATSESGQARAEWNEALLTLAVAQAYADAIETLPEEVKDADLDAFYCLWPDTSRATGEVVGKTAKNIHAVLAERPVFRCRTSEGQKRVTLTELDVLAANADRHLVEALLAQGFRIPELALPTLITEGAKAAGIDVKHVTPKSLRKLFTLKKHADCKLEEAPFAALRKRDWVEAVTRFILREKPDKLSGLPLCLLANGELAAFGHANANVTFIATATERSIFRAYPHWFIDDQFLAATGLEAQPDAKFIVMTPHDVLRHMNRPLPKPESSAHVQWNPGGEAIPNEAWLIEVCDYFSKSGLQIKRSEIENFPLLPDQHGRLHKLYHVSTPLLPTGHERLNAALSKLGLPVLSGSLALTDAVRRFMSHLDEEGAWVAEGVDLIDCLAAWHDSWKERFPIYTPDAHDPILDALSDQQCIDQLDDDRIKKLAGLRILPATDGRIVDAGEPDFYVPTEELPPAVGGPIHLAEIGKRGKWRPLLESIGVKPLDLPTLIDSVLLPALPTLEPERKLEVLEYIRTNFDRALRQEAARGDARTLKSKLGGAPIVRGTDGELHSATSVFSPELESIAMVLGSDAVFPDLAFYPEPRDAWRDFFRAIGLKTEISANDILARIDGLTATSPASDSRKQVGVVFGYIQKHWQELKPQNVPSNAPGQSEDFASALRRRKWLPAALAASFPSFIVPEGRWFSPPELYPISRGHLVAGEAPLLDGQSPTSEVLDALGVPQWPNLDLVLRRFERVIDLVSSTESTWKPDEVRKSFDEICRFFGRNAPLLSKERDLLTSLYAGRLCIWDHQRNRLVRPKDVFQSSVRFFEPLKVRISADPQISAGLDALGRRSEPEATDFRDFLDMLARHTGSNPCSPREHDQALHALEELGRSEDAHHVDDLTPILTQSARLLPLREVLYLDNPNLANRITDSDVHYAHVDILVRGVVGKLRRLSEAVTEELAEAPTPSADVEMQRLCQRLQELIRSREFALAIRRLISHESQYPIIDYEPPLRGVEVRPAIAIHTTLLLDSGEGNRAVGGGEVEFFVDREIGRIWIATHKLGALRPKLVRAINEFLDAHRIQDTAPLAAILEGRDSIETVLENYEIPPITDGRRVVVDWQEQSDRGDTEMDESPEPNDRDWEASAADEAANSRNVNDAGDEQLDGFAAGSNQAEADEVDLPRSQPSEREAALGTSLAQRGRRSTSMSLERTTETSRPMDGDRLTLTGSDDEPPIVPGTGHSQVQARLTPTDRQDSAGTATPASNASETASTSRRRRGRFYSYLSPRSELEQGDGPDDRGKATADELATGRAAVAFVLDVERQAGWTPMEMSHSNPGYDIESVGPSKDLRFIEVKGIDGPWDEVGVSLSATQFNFAMERRAAAWLYVVEHARDPGKRIIHRIQDPANTATDFCFDAGWQAAAISQSNNLEPPAVGDEYHLDDGELVTVVEINVGEAFIRLRVRSYGGSERFVIWNPRHPHVTASA